MPGFARAGLERFYCIARQTDSNEAPRGTCFDGIRSVLQKGEVLIRFVRQPQSRSAPREREKANDPALRRVAARGGRAEGPPWQT